MFRQCIFGLSNNSVKKYIIICRIVLVNRVRNAIFPDGQFVYVSEINKLRTTGCESVSYFMLDTAGGG